MEANQEHETSSKQHHNCNLNNNNNNVNPNYNNYQNNNHNKNDNNCNKNNNPNNNNNNNNNHNNNNVNNFLDRLRSTTISDRGVCVLFVICIICNIMVLELDTLTHHSFDYKQYGEYKICEIEYRMHKLSLTNCDANIFGGYSTEYGNLCGNNGGWYPFSGDFYCDLEFKGEIYDACITISLIFCILSSLLFVGLHMAYNRLFFNNNNENQNNSKLPFRICVGSMIICLLTNGIALVCWAADNGIEDDTLQQSNVKNIETAWGSSLWCTAIGIILNIGIMTMVKQISKNVARTYNVMTPRNEAREDEAASLNDIPNKPALNNNNHNNNHNDNFDDNNNNIDDIDNCNNPFGPSNYNNNEEMAMGPTDRAEGQPPWQSQQQWQAKQQQQQQQQQDTTGKERAKRVF